MQRKNTSKSRRAFVAGAATAAISAAVPLRLGHAQGQTLKIGTLYPRSGIQAQIGIDCQRGVDISAEVLKTRGYTNFEILAGDTESNPAASRAQCERLINQGAHVISGCFDSGATLAAAQVCEQKGIPLVVSIAAAPALTEQGYKTVFRNFVTGPMIVGDSYNLQKDLFKLTGHTPKTAVLLHTHDTFGTNTKDAMMAMYPKFAMPYKFVDTIAYDVAARDLSAEVRKAKSHEPELLIVISRVNDAILITREMVKQRFVPMGIVATGPGWYENVYMTSLGNISDDVVTTSPWYDPNKALSKVLAAAFKAKHPDRELNTNHVYSFEGIMIAADAFKRAGSTEPGKLIEALKTTDIKDNVTTGAGIKFDAKGQNPNVKNSAFQNRGGKNLVVLPVEAAATKPIWPMRAWDKRG